MKSFWRKNIIGLVTALALDIFFYFKYRDLTWSLILLLVIIIEFIIFYWWDKHQLSQRISNWFKRKFG